MKLRIWSDLHNEINTPDIKSFDINGDVLILAGDIDRIYNKSRLVAFLEYVSTRHNYVLYIAGNHEFYNDDLFLAIPKLKEATKHLNNVFILENDSVEIDGLKFFGATLWSYVPEKKKSIVSDIMNDYHTIKHGTKYITTDITNLLNASTVNYFLNQGTKDSVIISHHAPIKEMNNPAYADFSPVSCAFNNNLGTLIKNVLRPKLWVSGHTHFNNDIEKYGTRFVANSYGYNIAMEESTKTFKLDNEIEL